MQILNFEALFDLSPNPYLVMAPDFTILAANRAYLETTRRTLEQLRGLTIFEAFPSTQNGAENESGAMLRQSLQRAVELRRRDVLPLIRYAVSRETAEGSVFEERFWSATHTPLLDERGEVRLVLQHTQDVSDLQRAEVELRRHRLQLEELVTERTDALRHSERERHVAEQALMQSQKMESLGKLTGGVAHDFNNVLQVIASNLQLLKLTAQDDRSVRRIQSALAGVDRGARLASHLLAFARKQPLAPVALNPGRLIRGMDDMLRRALGASVELETVISGGLWNTLVDPNFLESALLNLAINARDAMGGNGRLTIEAGNASLDDHYASQHGEVTAGQYVMVAVSDTGSGMTPEVLQRAFEPFFTTKPEGQGTGLGLSMVYGFVKQSLGHVKIYSEAGQGTTIRMYLPRSFQAEQVLVAAEPAPSLGGSETILVVEDDAQLREAVVETLGGLGYRVLKAGDAQSALTVLESGVPVEMLFTDVVMPGPLRSPDLARQARLLQPDIEVLFTSGYTENAIVHGGRLDAGVALLSKPYRQEELAAKIRHMLNNREQVLQLRQELSRATESRG